MRRLLALAGALLLAGTACSGESDETRLERDISAGLLEATAFAEYDLDEEEARCAAETVVDDVGTDPLREALLEGDEADFGALDDAELTAFAEALEACIDDLTQVRVDAVAALVLDNADDDFPVTEEEAACVAESVVDDIELSRQIIVNVRAEEPGDDPFDDPESPESQAYGNAYLSCLDVRGILLATIAAGETDADTLACLDANITDEDIETLFLAGLSGDENTTAQTVLEPAIAACT